MLYNQDQYFINLGRKATAAALAAFFLGIAVALVFSLSILTLFFTAIIFAYIALSSFWGIYNLEKWFKKYRYKMPKYLWYFLNLFIIIAGIIVGCFGYGFIEHFLLVLAVEQQKDNLNLITAQIILLPYLGPKYAESKNYHS